MYILIKIGSIFILNIMITEKINKPNSYTNSFLVTLRI